MRKFQKKDKWKYYLQSKPVLIFLFILILIFSWKIFGLFGKWQETSNNRSLEQQKINDLKERKQKLSSDIEKLNTDKGKEEVIRENYGMARDGEQVIVIVDDKKQASTENMPQNKGFFDFLKNLFSK